MLQEEAIKIEQELAVVYKLYLESCISREQLHRIREVIFPQVNTLAIIYNGYKILR